ncbi:hypothetical protein PC116_g19354 [Phytophthora cactorum]|nr:hypothetical protein PC116_g19354 [Phytophthora cactorum]
MGKIYFCDLDKDGSPQCPRTAIDRRMDRPEDDPSPAGANANLLLSLYGPNKV